ncbi:hypothetical protein AALO_G00309940 [Alosa alosa]|uniref:Uncharacterized protein n=1 Tax=Alosa alosa TaxID=278164 RepID=A0AAV6FHC7_9TELE|nr:hypothetical protein AALO_G00309940 [Alosa alosa]
MQPQQIYDFSSEENSHKWRGLFVQALRKGLMALDSPYTGIVDWRKVALRYGQDFKEAGGTVTTEFEASDITVVRESPARISEGLKYPIAIRSSKGDEVHWGTTWCSSQRNATSCRETSTRCQILVSHSWEFTSPPVWTVVWLGPNAVLAFKREGYQLYDLNVRDLTDALSFRGLQKLVMKNITYGLGEMFRGVFIGAQVKILQKFIPELSLSDVVRGPSGVRAQALDKDGNLVDDFVFDGGTGEIGSRVLHVRNAPSPAATSSLAIAEMVADEAEKRFTL